MAKQQIDGWSVSRETDGDEPVWYLTKDGHQLTVRGQAGVSDEGMIEAASVSAAQADRFYGLQDGDYAVVGDADKRLHKLEAARKIARLRAQEAVLLASMNGEKE